MSASALRAYADIAAFTSAGMGINAALWCALNTRLSTSVAAGATSLPVLSSANAAPSALVYILDGAQSEIVVADSTTPAPDASHVKVSATQYAHGALVSVSTPHSSGRSLAQTLLDASAWVENYCEQGDLTDRSLYSAQRTETYRVPTSRAYVDPSYALSVRPRHFPVQSVASLTLSYGPGQQIALDVAQALMPSPREIVVPQITPLMSGAQRFVDDAYADRTSRGSLAITYTAGVAQPYPLDLVRACCFAAQEFMAYRQNPTGAAMVRQGDVMIEQRLRGGGESKQGATTDGIFLAQARNILSNYRAQFI